MENKKRQTGYYRVRTDVTKEWDIVYYYSEMDNWWWMTGQKRHDHDFCEIDETPIKPEPDTKKTQWVGNPDTCDFMTKEILDIYREQNDMENHFMFTIDPTFSTKTEPDLSREEMAQRIKRNAIIMEMLGTENCVLADAIYKLNSKHIEQNGRE